MGQLQWYYPSHHVQQKNQLQAQWPPTINMLEFGIQMAELKELNEFESSTNWTSSMI
jgi:hypothetical protein